MGADFFNVVNMMKEDYLQMLRADLTIEGRLNRKRYWVRTGLCIVLNIMAAIFMEIPAELPIFFGAILTIAVSIYQIMFTVRRAHDLGRSGWYLLLEHRSPRQHLYCNPYLLH